MKINKQKRIGEVIFFVEGENPEFEIIEKIFNQFLGYEVIESKRSNKQIKELIGHDKNSKVILLNTPTNNINSLEDEKEFYDYIFKEYVLSLNIDTINSPIYFIFDRDPKNNRKGLVEKLLCKLTSSQNDTEEQNGLLILSYPSLESFVISLHEQDSYMIKKQLGKEAKDYVLLQNYKIEINEKTLKTSIMAFAEFLKKEHLIEEFCDIVNKIEEIGINIFKMQDKLYSKERLFYCVSQLMEILLDLQIVEF